MTRRELDAAGITDPALRACYTHSRRINARHGRTYFLATRLLAARQRPAVHALYGFARQADEIVDDLAATSGPEQRAGQLDELAAELDKALAGSAGARPELAALADTVARYGIEPELFAEFLGAMRLDLTVTEYPTLDALGGYMRGSAGVIGLQLLPVLGTVTDRAEAEPAAEAMGRAFQLTNFLRDIGEDLDRGRLYLPGAELAAFGVDRELLAWSWRTGRADRRIRRALAALVGHTRAIYRQAATGIPLLDPVSRPCVRTAMVLYGGILDEIVAADYDVLRHRVVVPAGRRLGVALPGFVQAHLVRLRHERGVRG